MLSSTYHTLRVNRNLNRLNAAVGCGNARRRRRAGSRSRCRLLRLAVKRNHLQSDYDSYRWRVTTRRRRHGARDSACRDEVMMIKGGKRRPRRRHLNALADT